MVTNNDNVQIIIEDSLIDYSQLEFMIGSAAARKITVSGLDCYVVESSGGDKVLYSRADVILYIKKNCKRSKAANPNTQ